MDAFVETYTKLMGGPIENPLDMTLKQYQEARAEKMELYEKYKDNFKPMSLEAIYLNIAFRYLLMVSDDIRNDPPYKMPSRPLYSGPSWLDDDYVPDDSSASPSGSKDNTSQENQGEITRDECSSVRDWGSDSEETFFFIDNGTSV